MTLLHTQCLPAELAKEPNQSIIAAVFKDCDGVALKPGDQLAKCSDLVAPPDVSGFQTKLKDCAGNFLAANTQMAKCSDLTVLQAKLQDCSGAYLSADTKMVTCASLPALVKANETVTTLVLDAVSGFYKYTNEAGATQLIEPGNFISSTVGNAITVGADGKLTLSIPAQLPDDQVLSGDNSGNVALTLTPTTDPVTGNVNYLAKADLKVAPTTPTGGTNALVIGASGAYVVATPVATATTSGTVTLNQIEALAKIVGQDEGAATSATAEAIKTINFIGAGVSASQTGSVLNVTVTGGGAADGTTFGTAVTDFDSPAPTDGNTNYRNTTTGELFKWDGVKWSVVGSYQQLTTTASNSVSLPAGISASLGSITAPRSGRVLVEIEATLTVISAISNKLRVSVNGVVAAKGPSIPDTNPAYGAYGTQMVATVNVTAGDVVSYDTLRNTTGTITTRSLTITYIS